MKLGVLLTHPVQYYSPWFRLLSKRLDLEVFYAYKQDPKGQASAGFNVEFNWDIPLLEGYKYTWLKNVSKRPDLRSFSGCDTPEVYEIIKKGKFDAFLVFGWNKKSYLQAISACWKSRVPVLMRGDSQLLTPRSPIKSFFKYLPYRYLLNRIDAHLYVGKRNKEYLKHYGVPEEKLFFVPHFVNDKFFSQKAEEARSRGEDKRLRKELGIPEDRIVCLYVGKFISKKRPEDFIRAIVEVRKTEEGRNIYALLVGDGPLRKKLENLAEGYREFIHFVGFKNQTQLPLYYSASDILILPSDGRETWGLVVNEAFACGIPAIVSNKVGCSPDLIEDGRTGYVYPVGNIVALTECILKLKYYLHKNKSAVYKNVEDKIHFYSIKNATESLLRTLTTIHKDVI